VAKHRKMASSLLYYLGEQPFSARFYSKGLAMNITSEALITLIKQPPSDPIYVAIPKRRIDDLEKKLDKTLSPLFSNRSYMLFEIPQSSLVTQQSLLQENQLRKSTGG